MFSVMVNAALGWLSLAFIIELGYGAARLSIPLCDKIHPPAQ